MNYILLFLTALPAIASAQQTVKGQLIDAESKRTIAYATISAPSLKTSTLSKPDGSFEILLPDAKDYTLNIEAWGYHPKEIILNELQNNRQVMLDEAPELMPELFIPPKNAKITKRTYGRTGEGSGLMVASVQSYDKNNYDKGLEFGMIMKNKGLSELQSFHLHLNAITYKKITYRLTLYEVKNGLPSKKINHQEVIFSITDKNKGWLKLDLSDKSIFLDESISKFAVVLSLVNVEFAKDSQMGNLSFNLGTAIGNLIVGRDSKFDEWHKLPFNIPMYITVNTYK